MNMYVKFYINAQSSFPSWDDRKITFISVVRAIASSGTFEDLQALVDYYEHEKEEVKNERITTAI